MAVSTDVSTENELTHTERIAREEPEAVEAVAERTSGKLSAYLERCLESADN